MYQDINKLQESYDQVAEEYVARFSHELQHKPFDRTQLLAFHQGHESVHLEEWWGKQVSLDFIFFEKPEMEAYLRTAGFEIEDSLERPPYAEGVEAQTRRVYIFARKPY